MTDREADSALDRAADEALALLADNRRGDGRPHGARGSSDTAGAAGSADAGDAAGPAERVVPAGRGDESSRADDYFPFGDMPVGSGVTGGGRGVVPAAASRDGGSAGAFEFLFRDDPFCETGTFSSPSVLSGPSGARRTPGPRPGPGPDTAPEPLPAPAEPREPIPAVPAACHEPGVAMADHRSPHATRTSWQRARAVAARAGEVLPAEERPLDEALGQVLAAPLDALTDLPPFDTSAMDGWAVAGPGPWRLPPEGHGVLAGDDRSGAAPLRDGHAVRIATGARVPPGATAVLRSEHGVVRGEDELYASRHVGHGQDIRPRGQECRTGDQLLPEGTPVTPAVLGLAAAAGYDLLPVTRRPRVEILVLGDELLREGLPQGGRIRDALGPMLAPWLRALGAEVTATRRLGDDADLLYDAVGSSRADLVVTTGGTASGPVDHVHPMLRRVGAELLVDGVAVRPGHPMLLARLAPGRHLVGLPGNPLAAVAGLMTLAEPLLAALSGCAAGTGRLDRLDRAVLGEAVEGHPRDARLVPVVCAPGGRARVLRFYGPAMLRGLAGADGVAVVPPGGVPAGGEVGFLRLPWPVGGG
ncbi:molybdopterin molybdenumtransferase MoeA [Streptomyces griseocarneus]|nr:molybdopterin molybdenumtransferase MoeA [Streptomyces griseocarneus]